jgi:hypothetical protein
MDQKHHARHPCFRRLDAMIHVFPRSAWLPACRLVKKAGFLRRADSTSNARLPLLRRPIDLSALTRILMPDARVR